MSQIMQLQARRIVAIAPTHGLEITLQTDKDYSISGFAYLEMPASQGQSDLARIIGLIEQGLSPLLKGMELHQQAHIDAMIEAFWQPSCPQQAAALTFTISSLIAKASATARKQSLTHYLATQSSYRHGSSNKRPMIMASLLTQEITNGILPIDFAEILLVPIGASSVKQSIHWCQRVQQALALNLATLPIAHSKPQGCYDVINDNFQGLRICQQSIEDAGFSQDEVKLAINVDAPQFFINGEYVLRSEQQALTQTELISYYQKMLQSFPICYLQNAFVDNNDLGWQQLLQGVRNQVWPLAAAELSQEFGSPSLFKKRLKQNSINTLVFTPNTAGTLSQLEHWLNNTKLANKQLVINVPAQQAFEETLIALAEAWQAQFIKLPTLTSAEHLHYYNQTLQYETNSHSRSAQKWPAPVTSNSTGRPVYIN